MSKRPKIKVELTYADMALELIAVGLLVSIWWLVLSKFADLPEIVPTHFNIAGHADRFGNKQTLIFLPASATGIYLLLTVLNQFPHIFNYPVDITTENAPRLYKLATQMLRFVKMTCLIIFGMIVYQNISVALGQSEGLGSWVIPASIGLTFIPLIYFLVKSTAKTD